VYKVDSSSVLDCTYVISASLEKQIYEPPPVGPGVGPSEEYIYNTACINLSGTAEPKVYCLTGNAWYFNSSFYNNPKLFSIKDGHISADSIQYYSSLVIDSVTSYNDVYKVKYVPAYGFLVYNFIKDSSCFYINESIGIVRKDLYQGNGVYKRYYLKRYHIIK
jgi:hypothetical protein